LALFTRVEQLETIVIYKGIFPEKGVNIYLPYFCAGIIEVCVSHLLYTIKSWFEIQFSYAEQRSKYYQLQTDSSLKSSSKYLIRKER